MARILTLTSILACSTSVISSNVVRSLVRWYDHDPKAHMYKAVLQYTRVYYVECYDSRAQFHNNCSLIIDTLYDSNSLNQYSKNDKKPCKLPSPSAKSWQSEMMVNISPLSDHKILIGRGVLSNDSILIVNLQLLLIDSTNCEITVNEISLTKKSFHNMHVLVSKDSFAVAYEDKNLCRRLCLQTFSDDGHSAKGPFDFGFSVQKAQEYLLLSGTNENLTKLRESITIESEERLNATLFFSDGIRKSMEEFDNVFGRALSTANGIVSFCKQHRRHRQTLKCSQGNLTQWTELSFKYEVQNFLIHSLPGFKYLVLTSELLNSISANGASLQFHLTVFDGYGVCHNGVKVFQLRANDGLFTLTHGHVFENDLGEYCISVFDPDNYELISNCFSKNLFKKEEKW